MVKPCKRGHRPHACAGRKKEGGSGPLRVGLVVMAAGQFAPVSNYKLLPGGGGLPSGYLIGYLGEYYDLLPGQALCLAYQLCDVTVHACFLLQILDNVAGRFKYQLHTLDYIINENSYRVKRKSNKIVDKIKIFRYNHNGGR